MPEALRGKGKIAAAALGAVAAGGLGVSQLAFQNASTYGVRCGQGYGYGYNNAGTTYGYGCDRTIDKITTGVGSGGGPNVRIFEGPFASATPGPEVSFFGVVPAAGNTGGVNVARGDIDGDGFDEVISAPAAAGAAKVFIFTADGNLKGSFDAYSAGFNGGVSLAAADITGDGKAEIITGAGPGGGPNVRVFSIGANFGTATLIDSFFAYAQGFSGGVNVAAADVTGDATPEIITGPGAGGGPNVNVFGYQGGRSIRASFFAYDTNFQGGVNVGSVRFGAGQKEDVLTGPGAGGGPNVRTFQVTGAPTVSNRLSFFAYPVEFKGGVFVAGGDLNGTGLERIITGAGPGGGPNVKVFNVTTLVDSFFAYDPAFQGGVRVAAGQTAF